MDRQEVQNHVIIIVEEDDDPAVRLGPPEFWEGYRVTVKDGRMSASFDSEPVSVYCEYSLIDNMEKLGSGQTG